MGAGVLAPSWLPIMGVAVAARFIVGSVVMRWEDRILPVLLRSIPEVPEERLMPDERAVVVRHCDALVLGMGRVGEGVYRRLSEDFGKRVYGIGLDCEPQLFVLALPGHREGMALIEAIRRHHPRAVIASTTLTEVDRGALLGGGADVAVYLYEGAGEELADRAMAVAAEATGTDTAPEA